jgi:hypothetical protein
MLAYVTALYAIREGYEAQLRTEFHRLLQALPTEAHVLVFTDLELGVEDARIHVIRIPLVGFQTYASMMAADAALPTHRNPNKDTAAFLALMNTKAEMVFQAASLIKKGWIPAVTHVAWIDCGIHKIFREGDDVAGCLRRIQDRRFTTDKILMPGCWSAPQRSVSADTVNWRFCGGFFIVPVVLAARFYHATEWTRVTHFQQTHTWEVNVWAATEKWEGDLFAWWSADHNIRMLQIPVGST